MDERKTNFFFSLPAAVFLLAIAALFSCADLPKRELADCAYVRGVPGPEDFAVQSTGSGAPRLIVSSQERRELSPAGEPELPGEIFRVEIGSGQPGLALPFRIKGRDDFPFHPHGIYLSGGTLYVINHVHAERHVIEIYSVSRRTLGFTGRLESDLLVAPNDLVVAPGGQIYVTNDRGRRGFVGGLESLFGLSLANVVRYDGAEWSLALTGLSRANGIEVSPAGHRLYVAGSGNRAVFEFERDPGTGDIGARLNKFKLGGAVDNLYWQDSVRLLATAHPGGWSLWRHGGNPAVRSPSRVYRIDVTAGSSELIYNDEGETIDAASVAALYRGRIYIGQVFDSEILSCRFP